MRLNHDSNSNTPSNHSHEVYNIPMVRYAMSDSGTQSPNIVNNMMYYQGIYHQYHLV